MTTFFAGAASVDITPSSVRSTYIAGFAPSRRATGVRERLSATALYFAQGATEVVLVSADLVGFPRSFVQRLRDRLPEFGARSVLLCATHTHAGPDVVGLWGWAPLGIIPLRSGRNHAYEEQLLASLIEVIRAAKKAARPARMRATELRMDPRWTRNDRKGGSRFDDSMAMSFTTLDGQPIALALNFACHAETLWEDNTALSPDFPGAFRKSVREQWEGEALFLCGPLGGMLTPNTPPDATIDARAAFATKMGDDLATVAIGRLDATEPRTDIALSHSSEQVALENDNWRISVFRALGLLDVALHRGMLKTEIHRLTIGTVEFLTAPGEPLPEVGKRIRKQQTSRVRGQITLCCDMLGYIMDPEMFSNSEYAYEKTMSLGPRTADALLAAYGRLAQS